MVKELIKQQFNGNAKLIWWGMGMLAAIILASLTGFTTWASCGISTAYQLEKDYTKSCAITDTRINKIEERNSRRDEDWVKLDKKLDRQNVILMGIADATGAKIPAKDLLK